MSASPRPQKKTAHTCVTCRFRKVRCDGQRDVCTTCRRLGLPCSYNDRIGVEVVEAQQGEPNGPAITIPIPRQRVRQACTNCHLKKARCSGATPSCERCRRLSLDCVYRAKKRSLPSVTSPTGTGASPATHEDGHPWHSGQSASSLPSGPTSPVVDNVVGVEQGDTGPSEELVTKAFDAYFRHVHPIPKFSFLHRASLMECYHDGSLDRCLVLALVGITATLTDLGPGMGEYGERCMEEAISICLADVEKKPSIARLQTLVIATKHRLITKQTTGAFMLHAIASRFATALRLNHENPGICFLARESRRRLMWSLYMIDSWISAGQQEVALWPDAERQIQIQLPCNERNFELDLPETTERLRPPPPDPTTGVVPVMPDALGFMALHVRIQWMRSRVLQCASKVITSPSHEDLAALPLQCAKLSGELATFEERLPPSFRWSEANLRLLTYSTRLCVFIMTHVLWRQCHLDLYRLFLSGLREALPQVALQQLDPGFVAHSRQNCYHHARAMADMFAQLLSLGNSAPITDLDLAGCAFQCSRVLYHGLQTSGVNDLGFTPERVRELATVCLRAARQSAAGSAGASLQTDIERLIAGGLQLPEGPPGSPLRTRGMATAPPPQAAQLPQPQPHIPNYDQTLHNSFHMPAAPAATAGPMMGGLSMPMADGITPAPVAPSHTSAVTTGSNAYEEGLGLNFGSDMYGMDWTTIPNVYFPGGNI
ncbi:hypothetical protein QBC35DRAFT_388563 [Podospora australis]|uniref:Zn(2)-C6 fungal-type domain-containing protein n=1 Tax=Podospora australis TaxID=1536484 RepID=A0AAN7AGL5_9PEZI|nr:hypothetical protein QBC35DRAFT_388563 [Podospora australis]